MTVNEFINRYKNQDMSEKSIEEMRKIIIEFRNSSGEFNLSDAKSLNNRRLELQLFSFIDIETDEEQINFNTYVKNLLLNGRNISDKELLKKFPYEYANFEKKDTLIIDTISRLEAFRQIGGNFFNRDETAIDEEKICKIININDYNYYQHIRLYDSSYDYEFRTLLPYFAYLPELQGRFESFKEWLPEAQVLKEKQKNQESKPKMETNSKENQEPAKIGLFFEILFFLGSATSIIISGLALGGIALTLILQPWIIFGIGVGLLTAGLITTYFVHLKKSNKSFTYLNKSKQNQQVPQQQSEEQIQPKNPEVPQQQNPEVLKEKT